MERQGLLLPDESVTVSLTIDIDCEMAAELNRFRPRLEVTLILHVGLGKDHFVPVSAKYGMSQPVRHLPMLHTFLGPGFLFVNQKDLRELPLRD
jgi:phosphatidylinositol-bisphosphatase